MKTVSLTENEQNLLEAVKAYIREIENPNYESDRIEILESALNYILHLCTNNTVPLSPYEKLRLIKEQCLLVRSPLEKKE
jgi:hypothetical protein